MVAELERQPIALATKAGRRRRATNGNILAEFLPHTAGTGGYQTNRVGTRLGVGEAWVLRTGRTSIAKRPAPGSGPAGALIVQVDGKSISLCRKPGYRCGAAYRNLLAEGQAGAADTAGRQANRIGARLGVSHGGIGQA